MTAVHRPLSDWVARLEATEEPRIGAINDGDERSDARNFAMFDDPWIRRRVPVSEGGRRYGALGLHHPDSGDTLVELDDYGVPLEVSDLGIALIDNIEDSWPQPHLSAGDFAVLTAQSREIRYFLLNRLVAEGDPAPELFHVLPWEDVGNVAEVVVLLLDGAQAPDVMELRHWVTPAVLGVAGPLEQMLEGLVIGEPDLVRIGSTALCEGLRIAEIARIPRSTALQLAELVGRLGSVNPFLRHTVAVVSERLKQPDARHAGFTVDLTSDLPKAASSDANRFHAERMEDDSPLTVEYRVTAGGRLIITVEFAIEAGTARDQLVSSYQSLFLPVTVRVAERVDRYWIALEPRRRGVSGSLDLRAPQGRFQVNSDQSPVGAQELRQVSSHDLLPSLRAADNAGAQIWEDVADRLPVEHPVRGAVQRREQEGWS